MVRKTKMAETFHLDDKVIKEIPMGSIEDRRFNLDWQRQGLACPYEHCIETMPTGEEELIEAVKLGMIRDIRTDPEFAAMKKGGMEEIFKKMPEERPELYKEIRKILDERDIEDDECWFIPDSAAYITKYGQSPKMCKLFGHECPGGEERVKECQSQGVQEAFMNKLKDAIEKQKKTGAKKEGFLKKFFRKLRS